MQLTLDDMRHFIRNLNEVFEPRIAASIVRQIQQSEPKVYIDGQLGAPLEYGPGAKQHALTEGQLDLAEYVQSAGH